jgi:lipoprotein-anchoring transpeptidase ErfK/SrfK
MTEDANDVTPYNQHHKTDTDLMRKYGYMQGKVVVVSLYGQAMRVYTDGQLVKSFLVTTGTSAHPSLPGVWWVEQKESPAIFKSIIPEGQPGHYPDTPVKYAILYHTGGYNLHDSWWRNEYGPGTQFPHADSSGNQSAYEGSHGCINVPSDDARWLYGYVNVGTPVIVY